MAKKIKCSKCGSFLELSRIYKYRYCKSCHADYAKENRRRHRELSPEQKKKALARSYVKEYIKRGKIKKGGCMVCGNIKSEAHHPDYDKPLEIIWLCRKHHLELHKSSYYN